jgi:hypothetical protein
MGNCFDKLIEKEEEEIEKVKQININEELIKTKLPKGFICNQCNCDNCSCNCHLLDKVK